MAIYGTEDADRILPDFLSLDVLTDPPGLDGSADDPDGEIYGFGGDDVIRFGGEAFVAQGGEGDDVLDARSDSKHYYPLRINGGPGDDVLRGGDGPDFLDSDVELALAAGRDTMYGGKGRDLYVVDDINDRVFERSDRGIDEVYCYADYYRLPKNVENLSLFSSDPQVAVGNALDNTIDTGESEATVFGKAGNDTISDHWGGGVLRGGPGDDLIYSQGAENITMRGGEGNDRLGYAGPGGVLVGGKGRDKFLLGPFFQSPLVPPIVIDPSHGAAAFEGAGAAAGDRFDLRGSGYSLGGTGETQVSLVASGRDTFLRGNIDDDPFFELQVLIRDGSVTASAYAAADFIFG